MFYNQTGSDEHIDIKDSNGASALFTGSSNVQVRRHLFLNWQGWSVEALLQEAAQI